MNHQAANSPLLPVRPVSNVSLNSAHSAVPSSFSDEDVSKA